MWDRYEKSFLKRRSKEPSFHKGQLFCESSKFLMFNFRTDFDNIVFWQSGERYHTVSWLPSRFLCINFCPLNELQRNWSELCYLDSLACSLLKYFKLSNTALSSFLFILCFMISRMQTAWWMYLTLSSQKARVQSLNFNAVGVI